MLSVVLFLNVLCLKSVWPQILAPVKETTTTKVGKTNLANGTQINVNNLSIDDILTLERKKLLSRLPKEYNCRYCQPEQVHIAFGVKVNQLVIKWVTFNNTKSSVVEYGLTGFDKTMKGRRIKFTDGGDLMREEYIHTVIVSNLKYRTTYMYHVGSLFGWSDVFHFRIPPQGEDYPLSILVLGDMGNTNPHSLSYIQRETQTKKFDMAIHIGDFAYNLESHNGLIGDQFMRQIQPLAANLQYMTCPGNHEKAYNYSHYRHRFTMPDGKRMYYSFDVGPIHFISINTEAYFDKKITNTQIAKQYYWLIKDLQKAKSQRKKRPWIVIFGHRPIYCSNTDADRRCHLLNPIRVGLKTDTDQYCLGLEPLLNKYGVDLALWGHEHSYERSWPVYDYVVYKGSFDPYTNPKAPVHITTGSAGCWEKIKPFLDEKPLWSAFRSEDYGYTRMYAFNKTHLRIEQVSVDKKGKVVDSFMLIRNKHNPYMLKSKNLSPVIVNMNNISFI